MPLLPVKKTNKYLIWFYIILYNFINCPVFKNIKQTLHYNRVNITRCIAALCLFPISLLGNVLDCFLLFFFFHLGEKKVVAGRARQVVVLYSKSVWEFAWADSAMAILDEWSSYRYGHLNRFYCIWLHRFSLPTSTINAQFFCYINI